MVGVYIKFKKVIGVNFSFLFILNKIIIKFGSIVFIKFKIVVLSHRATAGVICHVHISYFSIYGHLTFGHSSLD